MYVLPVAWRFHAHGGGALDFMECTEDAFRAAVKTHMKYGTTSIFPTLSSSTVPMIEQSSRNLHQADGRKRQPYPRPPSEGHYLNMAMAGGQIPENIKNPTPTNIFPS